MTGQRTRVRLTVAAVCVLAVVALQLIALSGLGQALQLPALGEVLDELRRLAGAGELWPNVGVTVLAVVASIVLAAILGVAAGYALWRWPVLDRALSPYLTIYYAIPVFAFYPALILFFGVNLVPIVVLGTTWSLGAVLLGVLAGFKTTSFHYERTVRIYGLSEWQAFTRIRLRAAAPSAMAGIRLGSSYALIAVIASEFILASRGLGWLASAAYDSFQSVTVYAAILAVVVLTAVTIAAVDIVGRLAFGART